MREIKKGYFPQREIKFRALFFDNGEFHSWQYIEVNERMDLLLESSLEQKSPWLEFTGLKDKNGVEIYEGDIVKVFIPALPAESCGDKTYVGGVDMPHLSWRGITNNGYQFPLTDLYSTIEVIGNIYQNPDLLDG